ncbi:unnamed protein product [Rotaria magnacalcarata]|uniref:Uncharacterized protein n=1 Tax=Rotaria magnacalcarata TaxID=392030 RepID=A0A816RPK7_9BILA|nr:unnamed protein product [Rotaria magnacalcarata]CAF4230886.1 unnamed protein product [Rotaria magnacalcarata]
MTFRKTQNHSIPFPICSLTDHLRISTPQKLFSIEKKALSVWLDAQYEISGFTPLISYRRTFPFERASKTSVCSPNFHDWVSNYQSWHTKVGEQIGRPNLTFTEQRDIILKLDVRFIFAETFGTGLADRITHLVATYLVALLTRRFLLFDDSWPEFHEIVRSSLAYRSDVITPWLFHLHELNANLSFNDDQFFTFKSQIVSLDRLYKDFDYNKEYPERVLLMKSHVGNIIHTLTSSSSIYADFLYKKLDLKTDNIFGCLYHSLLIPRLSTLIAICSDANETTQYILQSLMFPKYPTIGVQIRVGDSHMNEEKTYLSTSISLLEQYKGYFNCAQNLSNGHTAPLVYLMSDSFDLRIAAVAHWPFPNNGSGRIQVLASSKPAKHIKYALNPLHALRVAVFETFLFSLCDTHIITTNSGFGRFPTFASLHRRPFYSFHVWEHPFCSIGEGQVTFMEAGHQWSGI